MGQILINGVNYTGGGSSSEEPNNGKLTIKQNGTELDSFTANQATNTDIDIIVPTQASDIGAMDESVTHLEGDVPTSRKINGKALTEDVNLTYEDVDALPSSTSIPKIIDTYNAESSDGMSGKAVASAISNKVDKVIGKSLISDSEITRLSSVTNYDDTEIKETLNSKADSSSLLSHVNNNIIHVTKDDKDNWNGIYEQSTEYTDQKIADLINGAPSTLDTLKEIADAMEESQEVVEALNDAIGTKANDADLQGHKNNTTIHITASERTSWNNKVDKVEGKQLSTNDFTNSYKSAIDNLPSSYAPIDAEKNVQSDWNATDSTSDTYIKNKPSIPTESTVSGWGFTKNTGTYSKPNDGIPKTDLANSVQTSLGRADSALQSFTETDPTVPSHVKNIKSTDITSWNNKVDKVSGKSLISDTEITRLAFVTNYDDTELREEMEENSNAIIDTLMLGWKVPSEFPIQNSVSGNVFTQRVGRVDLGSLDWDYSSASKIFYSLDLVNTIKHPIRNSKANIYVNYYEVVSDADLWNNKPNKSIAIRSDGYSDVGQIWIYDTTYTDATALKNAMQGVYLYFELATQIQTVIDGNEVVTKNKDSITDLISIANRTYKGKDLTVAFADEIKNFSDEWAWIKDRKTRGDFSGINVCDYIPVAFSNGYVINMQIMGMNTYKGYGDQEIGNHVDFIGEKLWQDTHVMNKVNFNNGNANSPNPFLASDLNYWLNSKSGNVPNSTSDAAVTTAVDYTSGGILHYMPDMVKNQIITKRIFLPSRYIDGSVLINNNSWDWQSTDKLWIPSEVEVCGMPCSASSVYDVGGFVQYPYFANNMNRVKYNSLNYSNHWLLLSASSGNSTHFAYVGDRGYVSSYLADFTEYGVPVCFRI